MAALAPIRKTETARRLTRHGATGRECWRAETLDGVWDFVREDSPGTPWLVYHNPSHADGSYRLPVMERGSLEACQKAVALGWAEKALETLKAEEAEESP